MPAFIELLNTTISKYFRMVDENILRERILLAMMESKGRVTYNHTGKDFDWPIRYKRSNLQGFADGDTLSFTKAERHKRAVLPNDRQYKIPEALSNIEMLQNRGQEAIVSMIDTKVQSMADDLRENFCDELYLDGNAPGRSRHIHGFESFLGVDATPVAAAPGYVRPNDNYAGLSTLPGAAGGSWTNGTWPEGSGQSHYDYWSPIIVDYTTTNVNAFTSTTATWSARCVEALRKIITKCRKRKARSGQLDLILLEDRMYEILKNVRESLQSIDVRRNEPVGPVALGFTTMNFDGVDLATEFGLPVNVGYAINTSQMELCSMNDVLFRTSGPFEDESTDTLRWVVSFAGNMKCNVPFFGKLGAYGTT